jgi:hypothetical protein
MAKNLAQQMGSYIKSGASKVNNKLNKEFDTMLKYSGGLGNVNVSEEEKKKRKETMNYYAKFDKEWKAAEENKKRRAKLKNYFDTAPRA